MKVKKSSWHYKFLKWMDMDPSPYRLTKRGYYGTLVLCFFYTIFFGGIIEGIRHLLNLTKSEYVEYVDDTKNNKKENIQ